MTVRVTDGLIDQINTTIKGIYNPEIRDVQHEVVNLIKRGNHLDDVVNCLLDERGRTVRAQYSNTLTLVSRFVLRPVFDDIYRPRCQPTAHSYTSTDAHVLTMSMEIELNILGGFGFPYNCVIQGVAAHRIEPDNGVYWRNRQGGTANVRYPHSLYVAIQPHILPPPVRDAFVSAMDKHAELEVNLRSSLTWMRENVERGMAVSTLLAKFPMAVHMFPDDFRTKWDREKPSRTRRVEDCPLELSDLTVRLVARALNPNS